MAYNQYFQTPKFIKYTSVAATEACTLLCFCTSNNIHLYSL